MSTTLVKTAPLVTASTGTTPTSTSTRAGSRSSGRASRARGHVVDASGKLVMPGGIDVHTHLDMPFAARPPPTIRERLHRRRPRRDDHRRGLRIPELRRGPLPRFRGLARKAEGRSVIDYAFHMIVRELTDQVSGDMDRLTSTRAVTSFKLFMAYPGVFQVDDATIFRAL